jgi:hypothetical protein
VGLGHLGDVHVYLPLKHVVLNKVRLFDDGPLFCSLSEI